MSPLGEPSGQICPLLLWSLGVLPLLGWWCLHSCYCHIHLTSCYLLGAQDPSPFLLPIEVVQQRPRKTQVHSWCWGWGTKEALGLFPVSVQGVVLGHIGSFHR